LTQVYRGNAGRLNLLREADINAVIFAYGTAESAEVFISATTKPHGANAYRVWLGDASWWEESGRRLRDALSGVETAITLLDRKSQYAETSLRPSTDHALPGPRRSAAMAIDSHIVQRVEPVGYVD
jgi:hypothetical protein